MLEFEVNIHVGLVVAKELYTLLFSYVSLLFDAIASSDSEGTCLDERYMLQLPDQLLPNCESLDLDISKSSIFIRLYLH